MEMVGSVTVTKRGRVQVTVTRDSSVSGEQVVFDALRLTVKEAQIKYKWDHKGQLLKVDSTDVTGAELYSVEYGYDAQGRKIGRAETITPGRDVASSGTPKTGFIYDGNKVVQSVADGSNPVIRRNFFYGVGINAMAAIDNPSTSQIDTAWAFGDNQGTVRTFGVIDPSDSEWDFIHQNFGEFGEKGVRLGDTSTPALNAAGFIWAGHQSDLTTGLVDAKARWYDSSLGRFLSEDPLQFAGGDSNFYRYARNSPGNAVDPDGRAVISGTVGAFLIAATAAEYVARSYYSNAVTQYDGAGQLLANTNFDASRYNALIHSAQSSHAAGNFFFTTSISLASAGLFLPVGATGLAASLGVSGTTGTALAYTGFTAATLNAAIGSSANLDAGPLGLALSGGAAGIFGALQPYGAVGSLGGAFALGAVDKYAFGGNFVGRGYQIGGLLGAFAGTGVQSGLSVLRYELAGAAVGSTIGGAYYDSFEGALFGAGIGSAIGGAVGGLKHYPRGFRGRGGGVQQPFTQLRNGSIIAWRKLRRLFRRRAQVLDNKAAGDAVSDAIAARERSAHPGVSVSREEQFELLVNGTIQAGARRQDVFVGGTVRRAFESKVGATALGRTGSRVRQELARDLRLLRNGSVNEVVWEFSVSAVTGRGGPNAALLTKLNRYYSLGIRVVIN